MSELEALEMKMARALGHRPHFTPAEARGLTDEAKALYASLPALGRRGPQRDSLRPQRTDVYRFYDDDGRLLYVGLSCSVAERIGQHRHKGWWDDVAEIRVEHHADRNAASDRERELIAVLTPLHNLNGGGA